jgi:hypothetical protein
VVTLLAGLKIPCPHFFSGAAVEDNLLNAEEFFFVRVSAGGVPGRFC